MQRKCCTACMDVRKHTGTRMCRLAHTYMSVASVCCMHASTHERTRLNTTEPAQTTTAAGTERNRAERTGQPKPAALHCVAWSGLAWPGMAWHPSTQHRMYACVHSPQQTLACADRLTHANKLGVHHVRIHARTHAYMHASTHARTHACMHRQTHMHVQTRSNMHTPCESTTPHRPSPRRICMPVW